MRAVNNCLYLADIGLPGSVGLAVRVRNVMTEDYALAADTALSHFDTSKNPILADVILYKFIICINQRMILYHIKLKIAIAF